MAKNKRPFSSLLEDTDTSKAVQEALHAPAQLPAQETVSQPPASAASTAVNESTDQRPTKLKPGPKPKADKQDYTVTHVKTSLHRFLKLASVHYDMEVREIASEAVAAHPLVQEMIKKFG